MAFTTLGEYVKEFRKMKGMTQQECADSIGCSSRTLMRIENNLKYPQYDIMMRLFSMIGQDPSKLISSLNSEDNLHILFAEQKFGEFIKHLRKAKGLTQTQCAEGICSRNALIRIEKGIMFPPHYILVQLLYRLGQDPRMYNLDTLSSINKQNIELDNAFKNLVEKRSYDLAQKMIEEMKTNSLLKNEAGYRLIYSCEAFLFSETSQHTRAIDVLIKNLCLSRPDFKLENITNCYFANHELYVLNALANAYYSADPEHGFETAVLILNTLKLHLEKTVLVSESDKYIYSIILYNIALYKNEEGKYKECIDDCKTFFSSQYEKNMKLYGSYLLLQAEATLRIDKFEGTSLYRRYLYFLLSIDDSEQFESCLTEYNRLKPADANQDLHALL